MQRNDIEEFNKNDEKGILTNFYDNRNHIEKILWIRHDPDSRAKAIQEEFGINIIMKIHFMRCIRRSISNGDWHVHLDDTDAIWDEETGWQMPES